MRFLLGTHHPGWLASTPVPLFVSDRRLRVYRRLPRASAEWALDSGGFTELASYGTWEHGPTPAQYASRVRRYAATVGRLVWAAPQDWMCEPFITAKTGLTVTEHQTRTVANYLELRALAPEVPWVPVLQGWTVDDYLYCVQAYAAAGVDLPAVPLVGLGSVCRRQATGQAEAIIDALHAEGITRLHGFGVKVLGLRRYGHKLASADSLAWSYAARRAGRPLPECAGRHVNCANCRRYALRWRDRVVAGLPTNPADQQALFAPRTTWSEPA
jgi:hypothetical protein